MSALRAVTRMGILWLLSLAVAIAGMEAAHRLVAATDRDRLPAVDSCRKASESLACAPAESAPSMSIAR
jgi:hypothetical protein